MDLKINANNIQEYYLKCMERDREDRKLIAKEYGIPATKANKVFYEEQNARFKMFCKDLNIGKGKL